MNYHPDFSGECSECGASPTVVVENHSQPDTQLCGVCFFGTKKMSEWEEWDETEETEEGRVDSD